MNNKKLNTAEIERRKMFDSPNYRKRVKNMIEAVADFKSPQRLSKEERAVAVYFADTFTVENSRQGRDEPREESIDKVLKEVAVKY